MQTLIVDHPLVHTRLTTLRQVSSTNAEFRAALRDITRLLVYEASRTLRTAHQPIETPLGTTAGSALADSLLLVPVLRAGLGMVDAALELIPESEVGFIGVSRDEHNFQPLPYLDVLPQELARRPVFVLDPMLATGGTLAYSCQLLASRGATDLTLICAIAAPEGIQRLVDTGLSLRLVTAALDERLNDRAFIVPGLGDAGDRLFGPA